MIKNYLKLVFRSMNKHKGYSFINIAGLAVGLACFILISLWINFDIDRWSGGNYHTYVHLEEEANLDFFKAQIRGIYKKYAPNWERSKLTLRPITRIHLYGLNGGGPIVYVHIFSGLSVFVLFLAMVNFTNLSTARSALRAKEIGVRKTAGAYRQQLTKQILMESKFQDHRCDQGFPFLLPSRRNSTSDIYSQIRWL